MVIYPGDWEVKKLGEVCKISSGFMGDFRLTRGKYRITRIETIADGFIDEHKVGYSNVKPDDSFRLRFGDILYSNINSIAHIGKVAQYKNESELYHGANLLRLVPCVNVSADFLFYLLISERSRTWARINANPAVNQASINQSLLKSQEIILPPLKEQTAIAETLAAFDTHITNLTELITKKKAIRDGALDELMTGRTRLYGFCGDWEVKRLGECVREKLSYGINAPSIPYDRKNPAYLRITDITDDGKYSDKDKKSVITSEREKYTLRYGDIVLARTGSIGKSYLYDPKDGELVYAGYLIKAPIDCEKYDPRYIVSQLRTPRYWSWVASMSKRSVQPGINSKEYAAFTIPIPPLKEQIAIADTLSSLDKEISSLETERAKISNIRNGAINDLLTGKVRLKIGI